MYTPQQPGTRMAWRYHEYAVGILNGEGILWPRQPDPARTGLMARPPGYSAFMAAVYATLDRSFFATQLAQNLLTSLACVLLALAASRLLGTATGLLAGFFAAVEPHIALPSGFVLPDALSALPLMAALLLLTAGNERGLWWCVLAGACVGLGVWLRPNVALMPAALATVLLVTARRWQVGLLRGVVLCAAAAAVVLPITIRNYVVFNEFVPVSINGGLVFWQGVTDAGGEAAGAQRRDKLVMEDEAVRYGNPRYREWWAEPDGVWRDRDRFRRAREVIAANPGLYTRVVLGRMGAMLSYHAGDAPTVATAAQAYRDPEEVGTGKRQYTLSRRPSDDRYLAPGRWAAVVETPVGWLQSALVVALLLLVPIGTLVLAWADWRKAALLWAIPLYYLCTECFFKYEWRVATPMHYSLCALAAAAVVLPFRPLRSRTSRRT